MTSSAQIIHSASFDSRTIPTRGGVSLKPEHSRDILEGCGFSGWFEAHAENYMGAGGAPHRFLSAIRERHAVSLHGVGLSIGSEDGLSRTHLQRLAAVVRRYEPGLVSEHLAWSTHGGQYLSDLLPLPYTCRTLTRVALHIDEVQVALRRKILIENPSTYVRFNDDEFPETEFLRALVRRTGCGLLLDVNNVYVSAHNHGFDAAAYLDAFPLEHVGEIHLAGHVPHADDPSLLIDTHDRVVSDAVWALYARVIARTGPIPTLIEWDSDVPTFGALSAEAVRANQVMGVEALRHAA
jgi:uncharacterized protein